MSRKKRTKKKKPEPEVIKPPEKKEIDFNQMFAWSKEYINPWELSKLINGLSGVGKISDSYTIVAFFQLIQILSVIVGYFLVFVLTMPTLSSSDLISMVVQLILSTVVGVVIFYFSSWLLYMISKLFGGKVDFENQTYVLSVLGLCHRFIFFVILIFVYPSMVGALPLVLGGVVVLGMFVISFYSWYVQFQVIKQLNNFSIWRSLGVLVVFLIISAAIMSIVSALLLGDAVPV
ncbi:MAG: hypothetical protein ABH842_00430 [Candidatus Micrarchaeota archaeon]